VLEFLDETMVFSPAFKEQILAEERWAGENHEAFGRVEVKRSLFGLTPYVNIVESEQGRKVAVCSICSFAYCDAEEDYKLYCLVYERHPKEVYSSEWFTNDSEWAVYREFYCPGCGTQVEVDQCPVGMPVIPDARVKIKTD
jgi:acetone carboxylase gamma subunit